MFGKNCPTCNSAHVRRSRRYPLERVLLPFASACRCNECGRRFYSIARSIRQQTDALGPLEIHRVRKSSTASIP